MSYETHLSTQQTAQEEDHRLSGQNENPLGTQDHQPPPKSGTQKACRLNKQNRLLKRRDFQRVFKEGNRFVGRYLCIDYRLGPSARIGISVNRRYGSSPERNRFKRLVREVFRKSYSLLPPFELNVIPRQCAKRAKEYDIQSEFTKFLNETQ